MTHHATPKMTAHALLRCVEMGISTKRAKRVVRERTSTYAGAPKHSNDALVVHSATDPDIAVVWNPATNHILTVLPRTHETYVRTATGYEVKR